MNTNKKLLGIWLFFILTALLMISYGCERLYGTRDPMWSILLVFGLLIYLLSWVLSRMKFYLFHLSMYVLFFMSIAMIIAGSVTFSTVHNLDPIFINQDDDYKLAIIISTIGAAILGSILVVYIYRWYNYNLTIIKDFKEIKNTWKKDNNMRASVRNEMLNNLQDSIRSNATSFTTPQWETPSASRRRSRPPSVKPRGSVRESIKRSILRKKKKNRPLPPVPGIQSEPFPELDLEPNIEPYVENPFDDDDEPIEIPGFEDESEPEPEFQLEDDEEPAPRIRYPSVDKSSNPKPNWAKIKGIGNRMRKSMRRSARPNKSVSELRKQFESKPKRNSVKRGPVGRLGGSRRPSFTPPQRTPQPQNLGRKKWTPKKAPDGLKPHEELKMKIEESQKRRNKDKENEFGFFF
jgi:hypothetical protein